MEFKVQGITDILGLPMGPRKIISFPKCGRVRYNFETKFFPSKHVVSPTELTKKLSSLLKQALINDDCIPNCVRMWVFYIFGNFLAPDIRQRIDSSIFFYVANLKSLHQINWAQFVFDKIVHRFRLCQEYVVGHTIETSKDIYLTGSSLALMVYFVERTYLRAPAFDRSLSG